MNFKVLGIDPGLNNVGWAFIEEHTSLVREIIACGHIHSGYIKTKTHCQETEKLQFILDQMQENIPWDHVDIVAIEDSFLNTNPKTSLQLSVARGAIMGLCLLKKKHVEIFSPTQVKSFITGNGLAKKSDVQSFVKKIIPCEEINNEHVFDAIAVALTCFLNK